MKGRIWTGEDAKNLGLVDELGGFPLALKLAKQAGNIGDTDAVELRVYPKKRTTAELLMAKLQGEDQESSESKVSDAAVYLFIAAMLATTCARLAVEPFTVAGMRGAWQLSPAKLAPTQAGSGRLSVISVALHTGAKD